MVFSLDAAGLSRPGTAGARVLTTGTSPNRTARRAVIQAAHVLQPPQRTAAAGLLRCAAPVLPLGALQETVGPRLVRLLSTTATALRPSVTPCRSWTPLPYLCQSWWSGNLPSSSSRRTPGPARAPSERRTALRRPQESTAAAAAAVASEKPQHMVLNVQRPGSSAAPKTRARVKDMDRDHLGLLIG